MATNRRELLKITGASAAVAGMRGAATTAQEAGRRIAAIGFDAKPDARAYQMAETAFKLPRERILFAAFGGWDAAGASRSASRHSGSTDSMRRSRSWA